MTKALPKNGFTLIELLVVIAIIAILASVGLVVFSGQQRNARDARRKVDIDAIAQAMENSYSPSSSQYSPLSGTGNFSGGTIPVDPINDNTKGYVYTLGGAAASGAAASSTYYACAKLESASGGNFADNGALTPQASGPFYCRKNQQG